MESGPSDILAALGQAGPSGGKDGDARLVAIDRGLSEVLAAQRAMADRLAAIERRNAEAASGAEIRPETKALWDDSVRRFTGSIDVRLDILEDELGSLQDELGRLSQVARESADGVQRRLTRRYALGQVILGVLIVVSILMVWSGGDWAFTSSSPSEVSLDRSVEPEHQGRSDSGGDSPRALRLPAGETWIGVETTPSSTPPSTSGTAEATAPVAEPTNPDRAPSGIEPDGDSGVETIVLSEERFAVQLVGFRSEPWVWRFVEKYGLAKTARYLHLREQNRDLYVVLLGDYSTREQAKASMEALPSQLQDLKPWVRALPAGTRLAPIGEKRLPTEP